MQGKIKCIAKVSLC